jgi:hypothetical protein
LFVSSNIFLRQLHLSGSDISEVVGDCSDQSLDLHFNRAISACNMHSNDSACTLGRIICLLCALSSLPLIHPPSALAAAAAATAILRCGALFGPGDRSSLVPLSPSSLRHRRHSAFRPFDFVWKGNLSPNGVVEECFKRAGQGFPAMMQALQRLHDAAAAVCIQAVLLDVQVNPGFCFAPPML